ncbi:hypothetical protein [Haladaptatus sp. NG-WS-4]
MRSKLPVVLLALSVLVAGCTDAGFLGQKTDVVSEETPAEPTLVGSSSTGGNCVQSTEHHVEVETKDEDGSRYLVVSGDVSVPDAAYVLDVSKLEQTGVRNYTLRVSSHRATKKPKRGCAAVANYTATIEVPRGGPNREFTLTVVHDGEAVHRQNVTSR